VCRLMVNVYAGLKTHVGTLQPSVQVLLPTCHHHECLLLLPWVGIRLCVCCSAQLLVNGWGWYGILT
jgi:hypothetical protein